MLLDNHQSTSKFKQKDYDPLLASIANYAISPLQISNATYETARICLLDSFACAMLAINDEQCRLRMGSYIPELNVTNGINVPGTNMFCDPMRAGFSFTAAIRWLDFNDTWLAAEWGHPSDNLGAIWSLMNFVDASDDFTHVYTMGEVLAMMVKAYEIQGVIALENSFNRVGLDHVLLVKVASAAVGSAILDCDIEQTLSAVSNAWLDGQSLRTYRHGVNTGPRKSWAAADAVMRALNLVWLSKFAGEPGYPKALSAKTWGFNDVLFKGKELSINQKFDSYVMDNILLKVAFPAEFHAQTAVECGFALHEMVGNKIANIEKIEVRTQSAAMRIINKPEKLTNYADRDHCLQYMLAVALLKGELDEHSYSDAFAAANPEIEMLRTKMYLVEEPQFTEDYLDPDKRSIANAVKVYFDNGTSTDEVIVEYPLGHKMRRKEAISVLKSKFAGGVSSIFDDESVTAQQQGYWDMPIEKFLKIPVSEFAKLWIKN